MCVFSVTSRLLQIHLLNLLFCTLCSEPLSTHSPLTTRDQLHGLTNQQIKF